jgi:thiamine phosphate synthase YjbQ (UPF0047 family)
VVTPLLEAAPGATPVRSKVDLGLWEQIFYGEFDGRRRKRALAKIIREM